MSASQEPAREDEAAAEARRRAAARWGGLCPSCAHARIVESDRGSLFLLCGRARDDPRYPKYPPQPVVACPGHRG